MKGISANRLVLYISLYVASNVVCTMLYYYSTAHGSSRTRPVLPPGSGNGHQLLRMDPAEGTRPSLDGKLTGDHNLTLTIRTAAVPGLLKHLYCTMIRSAALFWSPKYGPITLIFDEESEADHKLETKLRRQEPSLMGMKFDFKYEPKPAGLAKMKLHQSRGPGYNRQLWSFFHMDLFVSAPIIALTDTDAMFTTPVTPENIFTGDRLRAIGLGWTKKNKLVQIWADVTEVFIGKKMVANFMVYFPCYIWRDTITNCRQHCLKHLKVKSIEEASKILHKRLPTVYTSPISVVMNYAYHFEYERYDWHLNIADLHEFNAMRRFAPGENVTSRDTTADIHVTIHEKYYIGNVWHVLKKAYCAAKRRADQPPAFCAEFQNATNFYLYQFQLHENWVSWCGGEQKGSHCRSLISSHYENAVQYFRAGWYDLNVSRVRAVEKAAGELDIKCPKVFDDNVV